MNENITPNRILQLRRSKYVYKNFDVAKSVLEGLNRVNGEIILAAYSNEEGNQGTASEGAQIIGSAIGVYYGNVCTVFRSAEEIKDSLGDIENKIAGLQGEIDNTQVGAGLGEDGSYTAPVADEDGFELLGGENAPENLYDAIMTLAEVIAGMDKSASPENGKVVTTVSQNNGVVDEGKELVKNLQLGGYQNDGETGDIASDDTIETALSKLENSISSQGTYEVVGSDAIEVSDKQGNSQTVSLILSDAEDVGLEIVEGEGLRLSSVDCGSYDEEEEP